MVTTGPCIIQTAAGLVGVGCVVLPRLPAGGLVPSPNWCPVGLQCCPKLMLCVGAMPSGLVSPLEQTVGVHLSHRLR